MKPITVIDCVNCRLYVAGSDGLCVNCKRARVKDARQIAPEDRLTMPRYWTFADAMVALRRLLDYVPCGYIEELPSAGGFYRVRSGYQFPKLCKYSLTREDLKTGKAA